MSDVVPLGSPRIRFAEAYQPFLYHTRQPWLVQLLCPWLQPGYKIKPYMNIFSHSPFFKVWLHFQFQFWLWQIFTWGRVITWSGQKEALWEKVEKSRSIIQSWTTDLLHEGSHMTCGAIDTWVNSPICVEEKLATIWGRFFHLLFIISLLCTAKRKFSSQAAQKSAVQCKEQMRAKKYWNKFYMSHPI